MELSIEQAKVCGSMAAEIIELAPECPKEFIEALSTDVLGGVPLYSALVHRALVDVTTATVGAFVLCHARDPETREDVIVMIQRGKNGSDNKPKFGLPGGYVNLDKTEASTFIKESNLGEQPNEGGVRELSEEVIDPRRKPILDIDPKRLRPVLSGIGYRNVDAGGYRVQYTAFEVRLNPKELAAVKTHCERMKTSNDYKAQSQKASNGEIANVFVMSLTQAEAMTFDQFEHKHELEAIKLLASQPRRRITVRKLPTSPFSAQP